MFRKLLLLALLVSPLGFYPFLRDDGTCKPPVNCIKPVAYRFSKQEELALHCLTIFPGQTFPAVVPWEPLRVIGEDRSIELRTLAEKDPVEFLERCMSKYRHEVKGYQCTFFKRERVKGNLQNPERLICHFREEPFSIHMDWKQGATAAQRSLYVQGENNGKLVARVNLFGIPGPVVERAVDDPSAKAASRFPITNFGMRVGLQQTLDAIHQAKAAGTLHLKFLGAERVEKLDNQVCYKFRRAPYTPPENDGVADFTFYIDPDTLLQVGSILKDSNGELIAEYFFANIELNPTFSPKQFTKKSM
jgi:hypothetical protein